MKRAMKCAFLFFSLMFFNFAASVDKEAEKFYKDASDLFEKKEYETAVSEYENAVNLDNDYFYIMCSNRIFEILLNQSNTSISEIIVKICQDVLQKQENSDFFVLYYLGWSQLNLGIKDEAIKNLEKAVAIMKSDGVDTDLAEKLLKKAKS